MAGEYKYGDTDPQSFPIATATSCERGDLMGISSGNLITAAGQAWDTNEATTRANFVALYVGQSSQKKAASTARVFGNSNDNILVVYQGGCTSLYDAVSDTYTAGDLLGPAKDTGNALLPSTLKKVTLETEATHVCVKTTGASATQVMAKQRIPPKNA